MPFWINWYSLPLIQSASPTVGRMSVFRCLRMMVMRLQFDSKLWYAARLNSLLRYTKPVRLTITAARGGASCQKSSPGSIRPPVIPCWAQMRHKVALMIHQLLHARIILVILFISEKHYVHYYWRFAYVFSNWSHFPAPRLVTTLIWKLIMVWRKYLYTTKCKVK